jgi:2-C-methyl-D-erythritol 4-phosphate cytidylyltransferase
MNNIGIILAGGIGQRYGSSIPKQYIKLNGKIVIHYILDEYIKSNLFNKIIIVVNDLRYKYLFKNYDKNLIKIIKGGKTRTQTIYNALKFIKKYNSDTVFFQDAVRPLINAEDLPQYLEALKGFDCVVTYEPITDALFDDTDRNKYKLIQSPDVVKFDKLYKEINIFNHTDAIYQQLKNPKINFIKLNHANNKITYPYDLFILEHLIKYDEYTPRIPDLKNKNILLLGSSGGIGTATYKSLLLYNPNQIWTPSHRELNLSENFSDSLINKYCGLDIIINCAGIPYKNEDSLLSHYEEMMNVNFRANVLLIESAKKIRKYHDRPINIVVISSSSATKGRFGFTIYSASKSALHSLVESQAEELAKKEIYLNCICPEKVITPFWKKLKTKINKQESLTPQKVTDMILSYSDTKEFGKIIHVRKGLYE